MSSLIAAFTFLIAASSANAAFHTPLLSPQGGSIVRAGSFLNVSWARTNGISYVQIELHYKGTLRQTLNQRYPNDGRDFSYRLPVDAQHGFEFSVVVRNLPNGTVAGESPYFYITSPLELFEPAQDTSWRPGQFVWIRWTTFLKGGTVNLELINDRLNQEPIEIASNVEPQLNEFRWKVFGDTTPDENYFVRIFSTNQDQLEHLIGPLTIFNPLELFLPRQGVLAAHGSNQSIWWRTGDMSDNVELAVIRGGLKTKTITASTKNTGRYAWIVDSDLKPAQTFSIRIQPVGRPELAVDGPLFHVDRADANF